jgi:hypothetical protein
MLATNSSDRPPRLLSVIFLDSGAADRSRGPYWRVMSIGPRAQSMGCPFREAFQKKRITESNTLLVGSLTP